MLRPLILPTFAALALLPACASELPWESPPQPPAVAYAPASVTAVPSVGPVTGVAAEGAVDVDVTAGAPASVKVACAAELLPHIHVESRGEILRVWTDPEFRGRRANGCLVLVGVEHLRSLALSGSGDGRVRGRADELDRVTTTGSGDVAIDDLPAGEVHLTTSGSGDIGVRGLHARDLAIEARGSGDVHVAGVSERVRIACSGSGDIDARGLGAADVEVRASGSGDVEVQASRRADVGASGSGDVVVAGKPAERTADRSGSGSIAFQ